MFIIYRRTGGVLATLTFAAVVLTATVLTAAVAAVVLLVGLSIVATVLLGRAVLPKSWRPHPVPSPTPWPLETIDASVVTPTPSSDEHSCRYEERQDRAQRKLRN